MNVSYSQEAPGKTIWAYNSTDGGSNQNWVFLAQPTVVTNSASGVGENTATLNGTVNANGTSTTAWFEYGGTSGTYTNTSSVQSVSGTTNTTISASISGLSSSTNYYYRAVAQNSIGTTYGSEVSFTTSTPPSGGGGVTVTTPTYISANSTSPSSSATNVSADTSISATFSDTINGSTISSNTFKVTKSGSSVSGSLTTSGSTATFTPASALSYNTTYTATLTTGIKASNASQASLSSDYSWSFTTASPTDAGPPSGSIAINNGNEYTTSAGITLSLSATDDIGVTGYYLATGSSTPAASDSGWTSITSAATYSGSASYTLSSGDGNKTLYAFYKDSTGNVSAGASDSITLDTTPPAVTTTDPANNATGVAIDAVLTATFSENMDSSTIGTSTFTFSGLEIGTITYSGTTVTITPKESMKYRTTYTGTITTGVNDIAGNPMASNYGWSFTTTATQDTTAPNGTIVINSGSDYTTTAEVTLSLSATDDTGVTGYYISTGSSTPSLSDSNWVSGTASASYSTSVSYILSSGDGEKTLYAFYRDAAGNISGGASDSITLDTTPPAVTTTDPANNATSVAVTASLTATFSENLDSSTIGTSTITFSGFETGTFTYSGTTLTITPKDPLQYRTTYAGTITTGVKDIAGNQMAANYSWSFATMATPDTTAPIGSIVISGGSDYTTSTGVTLTLSATDNTGVTDYYISTGSSTPSLTDSRWVSGTATTTFSANVSYAFQQRRRQ